jgi:hypothetical protein
MLKEKHKQRLYESVKRKLHNKNMDLMNYCKSFCTLMILYLSLSAVLFAVLLSLLLQEATADLKSNVLGYKNPTLDLSLNYPANWQKIEDNNMVMFVAPSQTGSSFD